MHRSIRVLSLVAILSLATAVASAQWSADPAQNLGVAVRAGEQVIPKIAAAPDGGAYVGWFDNSSGEYEVYLQRLDPNGSEKWPHNGILVSNHAQDTSLVDWDLIADSSGNAVLVFTDLRSGGDLDVYAYRIAPDGTFLWGPDGVALSANDDYEPSPRVTETSDGKFVFVWPRLPSTGTGSLVIQKLDAAGTPQYGPTGITITGATNEKPAFQSIVPAEQGGFIVAYVRDIRTFTSPRHIRAQKFSATGDPAWGASPVVVYDAASVPIAYWPEMVSDGGGGAVIGWHRSASNMFSAFVQHLASNGVELFPHNGVELSTNASVHKIAPCLAWQGATGEILAFWNERSPNQDRWGIVGQKVSAAGQRTWTDSGATLLPVNTTEKSSPRCVPFADGALVFVFDHPTGSVIDSRVVAMRVDGAGAQQWPTVPLPACSVLSGKDKLDLDLSGRQVVLAWEDERTDAGDVYAQNILGAGGALGLVIPGEVSPPGAKAPLRFLNATSLAWEPGPASGSAVFNLYRGGFTTLGTGPIGACAQSGVSSPAASDTAVPSTGDGYFYLVTGENLAGEGPMGQDSRGAPRVPASACP